jgi:hypothetical protein
MVVLNPQPSIINVLAPAKSVDGPVTASVTHAQNGYKAALYVQEANGQAMWGPKAIVDVAVDNNGAIMFPLGSISNDIDVDNLFIYVFPADYAIPASGEQDAEALAAAAHSNLKIVRDAAPETPAAVTLTLPELILAGDLTGSEAITVFAETITDAQLYDHAITLSVPVAELNEVFTYTSAANDGADPTDMMFDLRVLDSVSCPEVQSFEAAFNYADDTSSRTAPLHSGTVVTPYGDWRAFVEDSVWSALNANDDAVKSIVKSFSHTKLFHSTAGCMHTDTADALQAFYEAAAVNGKLAGDSATPLFDLTGARASAPGKLQLAVGDKIVAYVKYTRDYALTYALDATSAFAAGNFSSANPADTTDSTGLNFLIGRALVALKDRSSAATLTYKIELTAMAPATA